MTKQEFHPSLPQFQDEEACFQYIVNSRWPKSFVCPLCGETAPSAYRRQCRLALECPACRKIVSATSGTTMHGTRKPLRTWVLAAFTYLGAHKGISAPELRKRLGLKRHETAYRMLRALREAVPSPWTQQLDGAATVKRLTLGGQSKRSSGQPVVIVVGENLVDSQIRLFSLPNPTQGAVIKVIRAAMKRGSEIVTDLLPPIHALRRSGYEHVIEPNALRDIGYRHRPVANSVSTRLRRWHDEVLHGAIGHPNLQPYLDEWAWRFNAQPSEQEANFKILLGISPTACRVPS